MPSPTAFKSTKIFDYDYAYLDSGAPASANYTTWVIFHGMGFNGAVFEKLLPLAHAHNLRIVSVNRRGYPPSSGFQEDELKGIGHGKKIEEAEPFYCSQGVEIATFLARFATEQDIPLADKHGGPAGGIALIGWSLGTFHALAVLAFADELPDVTRSTLQKYLHTVLAHDTNTSTLGMPSPVAADLSPWLEPDGRKRFDIFFDSVTGHFTHKSITSGNMNDLEFNKPSDAPHSLCELSYEQRSEYTNPEAFIYTGCDGKLLFCDITASAVVIKRALFDKARAETLPNVRVRFMSSGTSGGLLIWPLWELRRFLEDPREVYGPDAEKARDVKIVFQTEGNHFVFWEDPEKAIQQFSATINL